MLKKLTALLLSLLLCLTALPGLAHAGNTLDPDEPPVIAEPLDPEEPDTPEPPVMPQSEEFPEEDTTNHQ